MKTSIFELFKIGIGPSSSHTVGPMRAACDFAERLMATGLLDKTASVRAEVYGSLALTGIGHGTDRAILLGLSGERPDEIDPDQVNAKVESIRKDCVLNLLGRRSTFFAESEQLLFHKTEMLPRHPNGMRFSAFDSDAQTLAQEVYYSIGGGFIQREGDKASASFERATVPHPFSSAHELLQISKSRGLRIWQVMLANEEALHGKEEVASFVRKIRRAMSDSIDRGLNTEGILPGGLNVRRRAPRLFAKLSQKSSSDPMAGIDWVNAFAMAVNEENAAGGRVVTAPTNGAAGVIPAVLRYYEQFMPEASQEGILRFFLTAGAIGILCKENASISGAEVGCQGEVGVACSMAAAGLVAALNGGDEEVEKAAEIGIEHHLGMTCDPIGGLVQIPCIERNAIGAVKAINACRLAIEEGGAHRVSLDQVIETMYQTGLDMQSRYKETSLAGLALNVIEC